MTQTPRQGPRVGVRRQGRSGLRTGVASVAMGLLLLTGVGAYYGYGAYARSQLDELDAAIDGPVSLPPEAAKAGFLPVAPSEPRQSLPTDEAPSPNFQAQPQIVASVEGSPPRSDTLSPAGQVAAEDDTSLVSYYSTIYPGYQMHPKYWGQPLWAGADRYIRQEPGLPDGYKSVLASDAVIPSGDKASARRIRIPAIAVDSTVDDLLILDLGDSRAYETPDNVVGHIPDTSNPGEVGNGWFFGHLESPLKGEGNVFKNLPKIPQLLRDGDPVYITIESDDGEFLYQATQATIVYRDDLRLYDSDDASITLVACVPRLVYDHRLLVTAKLVGVKN